MGDYSLMLGLQSVQREHRDTVRLGTGRCVLSLCGIILYRFTPHRADSQNWVSSKRTNNYARFATAQCNSLPAPLKAEN